LRPRNGFNEKIYNVQGDRLAQLADLEELSRLAAQLTLDERVEIMLRRAGYAESIGEDGQTLALAQQVVEIGERTKNRTHLALACYNWRGRKPCTNRRRAGICQTMTGRRA
jgi:hypothetical protein